MRLPGDHPLNTLGWAHWTLEQFLQPGYHCVDATAGRGRDALFLCQQVGPTGHVLTMDIQQAAIDQTRALLLDQGVLEQATLVVDNHCNLARYAAPGSMDCVVFNLGWLPGGDHSLFTQAASSVAALEAGLALLRSGGLLSVCIYYGGQNGYGERDALLAFCQALDHRQYTVLVSQFVNRPGDVPIPVLIWKE